MSEKFTCKPNCKINLLIQRRDNLDESGLRNNFITKNNFI